MEIGSKIAITKLKKVEPKGAEPFYLISCCEYVYNKDKRLGGSWETAFYNNVYVFTDLELEIADFSLETDSTNKYDFKKIANPEKSILRVLDFKYTPLTQWERDGFTQKRDDYGKPLIKQNFFLTKVEYDKAGWKREESRVKLLEKKIEELKSSVEAKILRKTNKLSSKNADLKAKIDKLTAENIKLNKMLGKTVEKALEVKNQVKIANREAAAYKRKNTMVNAQLEKVATKLEEKQEEIKQVRRMKKQEVLSNASDFFEEDFTFGDI